MYWTLLCYFQVVNHYKWEHAPFQRSARFPLMQANPKAWCHSFSRTLLCHQDKFQSSITNSSLSALLKADRVSLLDTWLKTLSRSTQASIVCCDWVRLPRIVWQLKLHFTCTSFITRSITPALISKHCSWSTQKITTMHLPPIRRFSLAWT